MSEGKVWRTARLMLSIWRTRQPSRLGLIVCHDQQKLLWYMPRDSQLYRIL